MDVCRDLLLALGLALVSSAYAQAQSVVDVSVSVVTAPVPFLPGGTGTISLTVHNAGPDTATIGDTTLTQSGFVITSTSPPYQDVSTSTPGCNFSHQVLGPNPMGLLVWQNFYSFGAILAGESRTCVFNVQFLASTTHSFSTSWILFPPNSIDTNPDNNRVDYTFIAIGDVPVPLPIASWPLLLLLGAGLIVLARANLHSAMR